MTIVFNVVVLKSEVDMGRDNNDDDDDDNSKRNLKKKYIWINLIKWK